jgi:GNAT superfamily N-acetyltransferase
MITITAPPDEVGSAALAAAARMAVERLGGDGDGCALVVRLLLEDVRSRQIDGVDAGDVDLRITLDGTEVVLTLRDGGAPSQAEPATLNPLVMLGVVTGSSTGTDGHANVTEVRLALQAHHEVFDHSGIDVLDVDAPESSDEVVIRDLTAADAAGLTTLIYRCYGWSYAHPDMYYPDRIAAAIDAGTRLGEVAVNGAGELVAHWGAVRHGPHVVESGSTVTDPRYRHRGIAGQLGERLLQRLADMGTIGRFREPVLTHTATQAIALKEGAVMVGVRVNCGHPISQVGITDGLMPHRKSLTVAYAALLALEPVDVFVPHVYEPILRTVLSRADWPRTIAHADPSVDAPLESVSSISYDHANRSAVIDVTLVGRDLIDVVDSALDAARRSGSRYVEVRLPAAQPALAQLGEGLIDLGLAYAAYVPLLQANSDVLALQWLDDAEVDTSDWHYADDRVEALALSVVAQIREAADRAVRVRREAARNAR